VRLFNSLVKSVLLHGCETWKMTEGNKKTLDIFHTKCLRRIYKVFWPYVVSNRELLSRSNGREISREVLKRKWDWLGHILRRNKDDHCQVAITWAPEGKRKVGRPIVNWRRTAERERNSMGWSSWNQARQVAINRAEWRRCTEALCANRHEEER